MVKDKLKSFAYFLNRLGEFLGTDMIDQKFAYKAHYILCVQSVSNQDQVTGEGTLFSMYDNFRALNNGPVEWDIYKNRDIIPNWDFIQAEKCFCLKSREVINLEVENTDMIDAAFNAIQNLLNNYNTSVLINLTHELPLWRYAYYNYGEGERLLTRNAENRNYEYQKFVTLRDISNLGGIN